MSKLTSLAACALAALALQAAAAPVINEIMFRPPGTVENPAQEWIELFNPDATPTDVSGWKFTKGVAFTIPAATTIPAGGYLVVAAEVAAFNAAHPGFAGALTGGWVGSLTNSSEHVTLVNGALVTVDEVHFSNEGEWAVRGRGPLLLTHRGWEWFSDAHGAGKTVELRNPALAPFDCGQNWGVSAAAGGSPGAVNSVASADLAPLIKDVKHKPEVPHSTEAVQVSCNLHDEAAGATATLHWRLDGAGAFTLLPMTDTNGDGDVEATIPAQANLAIVEYYVSATDGVNPRTWPAPARTSDIGVLPETFGQVTNALFLVDNSFDPNAAFQAAGSQPIYRLIMTAAEKAELLQIQTNAAQDLSDAAMNATFISHDGTGVKVRYLTGLRNRGTGSRLGPPNNYHVGFRNDDVWEDRGSLQFNCRYPHSQALGALCYGLAGVAPQDSAPVKIRVNGVDLAEAGLRMYGRYVRNEPMSGDFAQRHFPNDPDGNIYFLDDHFPGTAGTPAGNLGSGEFRYEGTNPLAYSDTYIKKTNEDLNDYSDLITLTDKLTNTPDATFAATIPQYVDLDQWFTHFATDALIGNQEGGLQSGRADDMGMYRGLLDTRFKLIPHDFDSVFSFGLAAQDPGGPGGGGAFGTPTTRSIFSYDGEAPTSGVDGVLGLHRLFSHPAMVPRYYAKVLEQMDKWFNHATLDPQIDRLLGGWVAATGTNVSVAAAKAFIDTRRANVLTQIQQNYALTVTTGAAAVGGYITTTDGSATITGTFNVAKTYSVTVNGQLATWSYRTAGADAAGSWKLAVPVGGGSVLTRGLNKVVVNFWDGTGGTGNVVKQLTADVFYNVTGTSVTGTLAGGGTITWTPAAGPYRVTGDVTVPTGTTLVISAGTSVLFDANRKLTVNGVIKVNGTDSARVVFSNVPGTTATDPITGSAGQPAKWAGLVVAGPAIGSGPAITGSEFRYCTFFNAQPAVAAGNTGSLGILRAFALIDHCIFLGTHLRQVYGENCALQVQYSTFVDPFDPAVSADNPVAYNLDNIAEPLKVANANNADANYVFGLPVGGYFRVWYNEFRGNKGHNDVFDADSGGFNAAAGVNSTNPILDCRYNNFLGLTGDEHIDLGGDAYVAGNIFQRGHKDVWTNDHGYSNCISSGDKTGATTIWVARNIAFNVDHVMNCKAATATIFENNTVANFNADFSYTSTPPVAAFTQDVRCSAINQYVPDDIGPTRGDGAYIAGNIFHNIPRVVTWADLPATAATKLEAANNYINGLADNSVGPVTAQYSGGTLHPGGFTALGGYVAPGDPQFVDEAGKNYALKATSPARGTAPGGFDYGASAAEWIHLTGGPVGTSDQTTASFAISGPAMVAYKWRLDGGAWSAVQAIGNGLIFPRGATPTVRSATLALSGLTAGAHTLEVVGRDPAGNWQDTDLARTVAGLPPLAPTARTWTVDFANPIVRLNEVLAESATLPDTIELVNLGGATVNLGGWTLSDDPLLPAKYTIPANTLLAPGAFLTFTATTTALSLDRNGDAVFLHNGATLVDSVAFGNQIPELTIGRSPLTGAWTLGTPTLGAANVTRRLGDPNVVRLSEWFTGGSALYDADWIELVNPGSLPVDLAGLRLTDNRIGDPQATTFAALTFVQAGGFARFIADGATAQGPSHLSFSLDVQQENIALLDATGALLDAVTFYPQTTDYSMGRDAGGNLVFYELPTRGFLNGATDPAYANALALLRGLRITEVMYNALGGPEYDYVELRNVGATTLQLGGVRFVEGIDFTFPALALAAGQNVLVVKNLAKFRNRYGNGPLVAGACIGQLDNGGERLGLQLPPPFDANVLTFSYSDAWQPTTDGAGRSLTVANPLLKAALWGDKDTWAASLTNGGDPNGAGVPTLGLYADWAAVNGVLNAIYDGDLDGVSGLVEFSLGMNPASATGSDGAAGLPGVALGGTGRVQLRFLAPTNAAAMQAHGMPELTYTVLASSDLVTWTAIATKTFPTAWSGAATATMGTPAGGFTPVTIEDAVSGAPRFLRLQVTWTP